MQASMTACRGNDNGSCPSPQKIKVVTQIRGCSQLWLSLISGLWSVWQSLNLLTKAPNDRDGPKIIFNTIRQTEFYHKMRHHPDLHTANLFFFLSFNVFWRNRSASHRLLMGGESGPESESAKSYRFQTNQSVPTKSNSGLDFDSTALFLSTCLCPLVTTAQIKVIQGHVVKGSKCECWIWVVRYISYIRFSYRTQNITLKHFLNGLSL